MMYKSNMAVAIKSRGNILREFKDKVYLPFGAEYSLYFRNMNNTRALVHITIDGNNVTGSGLVVNANSTVDFERSLENNNLSTGNRFKFINRTAAVEKHRGVGVEDGLIRIEFQYEKPVSLPNFILGGQPYNPHNNPWNNGVPRGPSLGGVYGIDAIGTSVKSVSYGTPTQDSNFRDVEVKCSGNLSRNASLSSASLSSNAVDQAGITVPGSISNQKFVGTVMGLMESETHIMVLQLLGEAPSGEVVELPVTVKAKPTCVTCGKLNKATAKYCSECGTGLIIA